MPKRLTLQPHLSVEELERRYGQAKDPIERSHYRHGSNAGNTMRAIFGEKATTSQGDLR